MDIASITFITSEGLNRFFTKCKDLFATKTELSNYATIAKVQEMIDAITSADGKGY